MPEILSMIQVKRMTPAPAVLVVVCIHRVQIYFYTHGTLGINALSGLYIKVLDQISENSYFPFFNDCIFPHEF